jgi:hypothetical protein
MEPPIGIEPMTYALRERPVCALRSHRRVGPPRYEHKWGVAYQVVTVVRGRIGDEQRP